MNYRWILLLGICSCASQKPKTHTAQYRHPPLETKATPKQETPQEPEKTICKPSKLKKDEDYIVSKDGKYKLFITSVKATTSTKGAILFTHGAGSPASAIWDLPGDYSYLRKLACMGYDSYTVDVRGFGGSQKPAEMKLSVEQAKSAKPVVRAAEAINDVHAAVEFALQKSHQKKLHLVGWSWGSLVSGMYAGKYPELIKRLVLFAPVYDRKWPTRHKKTGAYRFEDKALYFKYHRPERESREVLKKHVEALFRFSSGDQLKLPNGPYSDIYGEDAPIWDAALVQAPTLVIRGEKDRASLHDNTYKLFQDLKNAPIRRFVEISNGGHFLFRTHRYRQLQANIFSFLQEEFHDFSETN